MKKPLKILLFVLLALVLVVGGYVIYVFASYDRIEDNQVLDVNRPVANGCRGIAKCADISRGGCAGADRRDAFAHLMEHRLRRLHRRL